MKMGKIRILHLCLYLITYGLLCLSQYLDGIDTSPNKDGDQEYDFIHPLSAQITTAGETVTNCGTRELSLKEKEQIEQEIAVALSTSTQIAIASQTASIDGAILIKTYFHVILGCFYTICDRNSAVLSQKIFPVHLGDGFPSCRDDS